MTEPDPSEEFDELTPEQWELIHDHAGEDGAPDEEVTRDGQ